jgi:tetratricopeptide (TPR) repeat protein
MAKGKKPALVRTGGFGMKKVDIAAEVQRVQRLFMEGDEPQKALNLAQTLCQNYPERIEPHVALAYIALELEDMRSYGQVCAQLMHLQPNNATHVYGLAAALMNGQHPVLSWQTMKQAIAMDDQHYLAESMGQSISQMENLFSELFEPLKLPREQAIALMSLHERAQLHLSWGEYEKCCDLELQVLELKPDMMPALNNLSLVAFMQNDLDRAIAQSEKVLAIESENIHALSNLVRYCLLMGNIDQARTFADRLEASQANAWDSWTKKLEGLSYVGDYDAITKIWKEIQQREGKESSLTGMALHFAAVALSRQGQVDQAMKLWQKALAIDPRLDVAQDNLNNAYQSGRQKHLAWSFSLDSWMTATMHQDLIAGLTAIQKSGQTGQIKGFCRRFFEQHPEAMAWIEVMLDRGDPPATKIALNLAKGAELPDCWQMLRGFALGQTGSESLRYEAATDLVKAKQLDPRKVRIWMSGEWQEISLITYEFHDISPYTHPSKVIKLLKQALNWLHMGTKDAGIMAEKLLSQALAIKTSPDLLNNLAVAYQLQDRIDETKAICRHIINVYPDYVPARVTLARFHLKAQENEEAEALLNPILNRSRFHVDDLATFSDGYLLLLTQKKEITAAKNWLNLWSQVTPDHARISHWKQRLAKSTIQ